MQDKISNLFEIWSGEKPTEIKVLDASGSNRIYYYVKGEAKEVIAAYNLDKKENEAFVSFSKHFHSKGLKVPMIYAVDERNDIYLEEYLGETNLYSYLTQNRKDNEFNADFISLYKKVIDQLSSFQIFGSEGFDYSKCYPRASFDKQSMMWDLNYFKYYFLRLAQIPFDEQKLEEDFHRFTDYLLTADCDYFLYRDFQSRNIMIHNEELYFIDYQGGRKGALHYDLASLLYDAKANIPQYVRDYLLDYYLEKLEGIINIDKETFKKHYYAYTLIRIMQAMGAYGFRGFYEKKQHFLQSIPYALNNIKYLLEFTELPKDIPVLIDVLQKLPCSEVIKRIAPIENALTVSINSFSYKREIPFDRTDNGGGFVFDCRAISNPGTEPRFANMTGKDNDVAAYIDNLPEMQSFLNHVFALTEQSVEKYMARKFQHLMINFGCTGGQHRSVYSAEKLARHLKSKYNINVVLKHTELEIKNIQ